MSNTNINQKLPEMLCTKEGLRLLMNVGIVAIIADIMQKETTFNSYQKVFCNN